MPFTTPQQFVLLAVVLVAGWLIGYASAPGTRKYKRQLQDETARNMVYRQETEGHLRAADERVAEQNREIEMLRTELADADRTIAALRESGPLPPRDRM
ncbi:hypothetical protein ABIC16_003141 [Sphingomonas sp. PvP055]|uniref:hypothetical protein n=1 Tax=Sphingomonas sp. PvP055 TaxID=3156391 RepID=UPI003398CA90